MTTGFRLDGLKVVDFTRLLPGPYATLVLADLGAKVIKIEAPKGGDYIRWMPPLTSSKVGSAFAALNSGKRSVALDLKAPKGRQIAADLCASADVVIESFRPGVMARLGLDYETLRATNPSLVYCAISGYGQDGPLRERPGHDLNYLALSGALGLAGPADGPPALPPIQVADISGSLWSLVGILGALYQRSATGEGAFLDVSMTEGAMGFLQAAFATMLGGGAAPPQRGNETLTGGQACYGVYETKDGGHYALAALEPKFWLAFCNAVERPDLIARQFSNDTAGAVASLFRERTRDEWQAILDGANACAEPVLTPDETVHHPLHQARGNIVTDQDGVARLRTLFQARNASPEAAPPLGGHTREVLLELGVSESAIAELIAAGVVVTPG